MFLISVILLSLINNSLSYDNVDCHLIFQEEMQKNLSIKNLTVQKLKEHLFISNYYLTNTFQKNYKIKDYNYLFNDICSINYNNIDYNDLKYRIECSKMSRDKFIKLHKEKIHYYKLFYNLFYNIALLLSVYLFNKYNLFRKIIVFYTVIIYIYNYIKTT